MSKLYPNAIYFERLGLLFERKQIPQIVVNVRNSRKATEPLEATRLPWAYPRVMTLHNLATATLRSPSQAQLFDWAKATIGAGLEFKAGQAGRARPLKPNNFT